jgi:hypothetical protein
MRDNIQDLLEVFDVVEASLEKFAIIFEDGKLTITELVHLVPLFSKIQIALAGFGTITAELSDLDKVEIEEIAKRAIGIITKIKDLFFKKK